MAKTQTLALPVRLPDAMQAGALRLLRASREAINEAVTVLWPALDAFAGERIGPAWKQTESLLVQRSGHGNRQERCEMESAGRILRAQATRKQIFQTILPLLSEGLIHPAEGKRPALKEYRAIQAAVRDVRADLEDADSFVAMTNVFEQACNVYLDTGTFPTTYEQLQPIPVQAVAQLTFAGDDGMAAGQTYRIRQEQRGPRCDVRTHDVLPEGWFWHIRLRGPDEQGGWGWWQEWHEVALPELSPSRRRYAKWWLTTAAGLPCSTSLWRCRRIWCRHWNRSSERSVLIGASGRSSPFPSWKKARGRTLIGTSPVPCFSIRAASTDGRLAYAARLIG